jgi:asparagine synthase (glutamine-hydrolysing)
MCGIAGAFFFNHQNTIRIEDKDRANRMLKSITHRGPDDCGTWIDDYSGAVLVHTRLSIRDVTFTGHQPMLSSCSNFAISYNGELYGNEVSRLIGSDVIRSLRGTSDTEKLIEALASNDLETTLQSLNGMYAFALVDKNQRTLTLARDRFGEKPLYYHRDSRRVIFASELKTLIEYGDFVPELDREAASSFMRHNYVPSTRTIIKDIWKVSPGTFVKFSNNGSIYEKEFFNAKETFLNEEQNQYSLVELENILRDSVSIRMISDVPIGCLLSGGIDSSLIAALMQSMSSEKIDTFTIGFQDQAFDEAPFAKMVAARIGTNHHELYVTDADALEVIPQLGEIYTEPFADSSQIPTVLVSRFARTLVPVVLTGDGGDEMFAGYSRYARMLEVESPKFAIIKKFLQNDEIRNMVEIVLKYGPQRLFEKVIGVKGISNKITRYLESINLNSSPELYRAMVSHWPRPTQIINARDEYVHPSWETEFTNSIQNRLDMMRLIDILTYLADDILVKVDRASMSVGLETRAPFLDPRVFSMAANLPPGTLMKDGELKAPLKEVAFKLIGRDIMDREKMGFGVPLNKWLRGPLRDWAEDLIRLENRGDLFNETLLKTYWERHLSGEDWGYWIWNYLMLKDWLSRQPRITV